MGPDWKAFVEELIEYFEDNPHQSSKMREPKLWNGEEVVRIIKDKQIQFLEKSLIKMDLEEGVEF